MLYDIIKSLQSGVTLFLVRIRRRVYVHVHRRRNDFCFSRQNRLS